MRVSTIIFDKDELELYIDHVKAIVAHDLVGLGYLKEKDAEEYCVHTTFVIKNRRTFKSFFNKIFKMDTLDIATDDSNHIIPVRRSQIDTTTSEPIE